MSDPDDKKSVTIKLDPEDFDWLCREVGEMDISRSKVIRSCIILGVPSIKLNLSIPNNIKFPSGNQA